MKAFNTLATAKQATAASTALPQNPRNGFIPINAAGQRLDPVLRMPINKERKTYKSRTRNQGLCTNFYLKGSCRYKNCRYDHTPINSSLLLILKQKLLDTPCHSAGACRSGDCIHGHVCAIAGCVDGKVMKCRFDHAAHGVDMAVAEWVRPTGAKNPAIQKEAKKSSPSDTDSSKVSMENWPRMVDDLIDI